MSAFGRKAGTAGQSAAMRPSFGVARPMKNDGQQPAAVAPQPAESRPSNPADAKNDALARLADRVNAVHENQYQAEGF